MPASLRDPSFVTVLRICASAVLLLVRATVSLADDSLPVRIDQYLASADAAPRADDDTFLRRIFLDLAGRIPSWQERADFLAERDAEKRVRLIDRLLMGPDFPRRMQELFHAMLMERRGDNPEWDRFLRQSFEANQPWDQLVRDILHPDPENDLTRGAAFFLTRRLEKVGQQDTDYPGLTRDVGRLFLGMDLQCAQCHNHLFIDDYRQQDFQGLFAVYQNTFIRSDLTFPAIGEKLMSQKVEFMSVFDKVAWQTGPRVPGREEVPIPTYEKGQEYLLPPDRKKNFSGIPRFSPLASLAQEIPRPDNEAFVKNIVNRLWFVMLGHGLVNPLDQHHAGNPPTHPELLALLQQEFVTHGLDIRWMLRELALTQAYQRSGVTPEGAPRPAPASYRVAMERRLSAEQIMASVLVATGPREFLRDELPPMPAVSAAADPPQDAKQVPTAQEKRRTAFVRALANVPQEPEIEFSPSLRSALFLMNDAAVLDCLQSSPGNLVDRLIRISNPQELADELYGCVLTRQPGDDEQLAVKEYLADHHDRRDASIVNLVWALLASTEFCLNH